jgi:hypothetical protein
MAGCIPENILRLCAGEEVLRAKALALIEADARLAFHLDITEHAMDLFDILRQFPTEDEDLKVIQVLGIRTFNAFASAIKLMLSGYSQKSALILRDILECAFLVDLFRTDRSAISRWRTADKQARLKEFKPVKVREALDARDGFTTNKRAVMYGLFSSSRVIHRWRRSPCCDRREWTRIAGRFSIRRRWKPSSQRWGGWLFKRGRYSERSCLRDGARVSKLGRCSRT